ncbi:MAG: AAA family ATPase [Bacteroidales bacterium]|nr:AAA family ATPase [Bacteroidales bacterium]
MITNKAQQGYGDRDEQNPFPGLRSFGVDESHLFFGREGQSEVILKYLAEKKFAVVTGASGSGKSSLIYCGLIPLLYGGFIQGIGSQWRIIATRPGSSPVQNLANALAESESDHLGSSVLEENRRNMVYAMLRRSSHGLIDTVSQMGLSEDENLLLIIDQFEEIFRYKENRLDSNTVKNETEAYIKLFINAVKQSNLPIYVVITMRSDFIGNCSEFQDLTKLLNESNYLIPQMTREDYKNAILGPLAVAGAQIDPNLVQDVLNSIGDRTDQLPVLQHAMMRTWQSWSNSNANDVPLKLRDYEHAGKIENALSMHANEAFEELTDDGKEICKRLFRTITEKGHDNKGIRRPTTIKEIAEVAQCSVAEVIEVVEKFRAKGRSFLTPSEQTVLEAHTVIDISHESLMRVWDKLRDWVDEEATSVAMYMRLSEAATMYQMGKTGLLRPPDLQLAINWKTTQKPNISWAKKYNPAFEKVMVYLDASEKKFKQEETNKIKLQQRTINRTRRFAIYMGVVTVAVVVMTYFLYIQYKEMRELRKVAENKALTEEAQKNQAIQHSQTIEIDRQRVIQEKDSLEVMSLQKIKEKEEETQEAYGIIEQVLKQTDSLQMKTQKAIEEAEMAEEAVRTAKEQKQKIEQEKELALRKRMLALSQSMAVKSLQLESPDLKSLLSIQALIFNDRFGGQTNHPDIYSGLYSAMSSYKGKNYNAKRGHDGVVRDIKFVHKRNIFYSTGSDGKILRWDLYRNNEATVFKETGLVNRCLSISNDGQWLACGTDDSQIHLYNIRQNGAPPIILNAHQGGVYKVEFISGKNQLISTGGDRTIKIWNLFDYSSKNLVVSQSKIHDITLSVDARYVYAGLDNGQLVRWRLDNNEKQVIYTNSEGIYTICRDKKGTKMALGDRAGNILVLNTTGQSSTVLKVKAHSGRLLALDFSPNGEQLASTSFDGTIKVWNANNFRNYPLIIREQESWVMAVAFSMDNNSLVSSSNNGDLIFRWPTTVEDYTSELCKLTRRSLTQQEWNIYIAFDIPYERTCR